MLVEVADMGHGESVIVSRPAKCTVFDGTVPYVGPCTICTSWYGQFTIFCMSSDIF